MSEFVLLRLDQEFRPSTWLRCDVASGPIGFSQSAAVAWPQSLKVIAVCASTSLAMRYVNAPKQGRERFRQAIAFALEDSVAEDVDELSFLLPLALEDGLQPVAVIAKEKLEQITTGDPCHFLQQYNPLPHKTSNEIKSCDLLTHSPDAGPNKKQSL